jgi:Right handed beta helix region
VNGKHKRGGAEGTGSQGFLAFFSAIALFGVLSMLPTILPALHLHLHPTAPTTSYGVTLMMAPREPRGVHVPAVAEPIHPERAPATLPTASQSQESAMVSAEDTRLRAILLAGAHAFSPEIISFRGSLPTLFLTGQRQPYTAATLVHYGALVILKHQAALLLDNVYVGKNATLDLGGTTLRTLYLDSGSGGFATIVSWYGNLSFAGTASHPMTITSWDRPTNSPGVDDGYGRSYIRDAGGTMTLTNVRASSLGFWSGRTGGVAWTGLSDRFSTGGATSSTFINDTYGAFVKRGSGVTFRSDLFEFNQVDGVHIHRSSVNSSVISSSAVRNGGNGFAVSPTAQDTLLQGNISQHNAGNGYFLDGRPLATGASASGGSATLSAGTQLKYSAATGNGKAGILVEGGTGTVLKGDQICSGGTAVAIRDDSLDAVVAGNTVGCDPRSGFSVGPSAPGIVLSGNAVDGARTGFLIREAGHVQLDRNLVTRGSVFGISARGATSSVTGVGNIIAGTGFRAIDARANAPAPALYASNLRGWTFRVKVTFVTYLRFHPLAATWLGSLILVLLAWVVTRWRRMPSHPYPASSRWRGEVVQVASAPRSTVALDTSAVGAGSADPRRGGLMPPPRATAEMPSLPQAAVGSSRDVGPQ